MLFFLSPQNFASALSSASLWAILTPRETEDNAYAKFWGDKQRALWYVMVSSGVVNRSEAVDDLVRYMPSHNKAT